MGRQIIVFLVLTAAFSSVPDALMVHAGSLAIGQFFGVYAVMWCPALAALVTCRLFRIDLAALGWSWPTRYVAIGYIVPVLYALPVYVAAWAIFPGAFAFDAFADAQAKSWGLAGAPLAATFLVAIPASATIGVISGLSSALGEEIGWRGFLLPRLAGTLGYTRGCLAGGVIWALWHYPAILWAGYAAGTPVPHELACFTVMVIADTFILGWLRLKSRSLWPCAILHASHNLFIQHIYDGMTASTGPALYVTTEFGAGLAVTVTLFALWFWAKRGALDLSPGLGPDPS